jgi:hypothetical protein
MGPDNPAHLTLEEHQQLGRELRATHARLLELSKLAASVYGQHNFAAAAFQKSADALERLLADLQAQAVRDLPGFHLDGIYR